MCCYQHDELGCTQQNYRLAVGEAVFQQECGLAIGNKKMKHIKILVCEFNRERMAVIKAEHQAIHSKSFWKQSLNVPLPRSTFVIHSSWRLSTPKTHIIIKAKPSAVSHCYYSSYAKHIPPNFMILGAPSPCILRLSNYQKIFNLLVNNLPRKVFLFSLQQTFYRSVYF